MAPANVEAPVRGRPRQLPRAEFGGAASFSPDIGTQARQELRDQYERTQENGQTNALLVRALAEKVKREDIQGRSVEAQEVRNAQISHRELQGDYRPEAGRVTASLAKVFEAFKLDILPPPSAQASAVMSKLIDKPLSDRTASFLHLFVQKVYEKPDYIKFSNPNDPQGQKTEFEEDFERIFKKNSNAANTLGEAIAEAAREGKLAGMTEQEAKTRFHIQEGKLLDNDVMEQNRQREQMTSLMSLFSREETDELNFLQNLRSPDRMREYYIAELNNKLRELQQTRPEATREEAAKEVTKEISELVVQIVNRNYSEVLAQQTDDMFQRKAMESGSAWENAESRYKAFFSQLNRLGDQISYLDQDTQDVPFFKYAQKTEETFNTTAQRYESYSDPRVSFDTVNFKGFVERLSQIAEVEGGLIAYGFNFNFIIQNGPKPGEEGGFFGAVKGFAERYLSSDSFDMMYALPHGEVIQAARLGLETAYKRSFAKYEWRKAAELGSELFDRLNQAERKTLDQLLHYYLNLPGEQKVPEWAIKRAFYHARMELFGKEFMFQLMSSYADPNLTSKGQPTWKSEGPFGKNALYDRMDVIKRFQMGDLMMGDLVLLPKGRQFKNFNHADLTKRGGDYFHRSFEEGELVYFEDPDFDGTPPLIAEYSNITKTGGVDQLSGWRVKAAYIPWIQQYVDLGTDTLDFKKSPDTLIESWKRLENIGIGVLKNFTDDLMFGWEKKGNRWENNVYLKSGAGNEAQYERLLGFLYRRYFQEGIGKTLHQGKDEATFMQEVKDILYNKDISKDEKGAAIKKIVYDAMTVALYERTPLEFIFMEKRRQSQNGVTLQSELMNHFVGTGKEGGRWNFNQWDEALDDLTFVQQQARLESIKDMDQLRARPESDGNIFGDLSKDKSQVLGGRGYAIDASYIEQTLRGKAVGAPDEGRIRRAIDLYNELTTRVQKKPEEGISEKKWKKAGDGAKAERARTRMKERVAWFAEAWKDYKLGMTFTADIAGQFMNRTSSGVETVARAAGYCHQTAEAVRSAFQYDLWKVVKKVVRTGDFSIVNEYLGDKIKDPVKQEDYDLALQMVSSSFQEIINALRRDTAAMEPMGAAAYYASRKKTSIASKAVEVGPVYDLDREGLAKLINTPLTLATISNHTKPGEEKYKMVNIGEAYGIAGKLFDKAYFNQTGKHYMVKARDWGNEVSGDALKHFADASPLKLTQYHYGPQLMMVLLALSFYFGNKAKDDMKIV